MNGVAVRDADRAWVGSSGEVVFQRVGTGYRTSAVADDLAHRAKIGAHLLVCRKIVHCGTQLVRG